MTVPQVVPAVDVGDVGVDSEVAGGTWLRGAEDVGVPGRSLLPLVDLVIVQSGLGTMVGFRELRPLLEFSKMVAGTD